VDVAAGEADGALLIVNLIPGVVLQMHTPARSDPNVPDEVRAEQFGSASSLELAGAFFAGMLEARAGEAELWDGGEFYLYRDREDFENSYLRRKNEGGNGPYLSEDARFKWDDVRFSFGLYNRTWKDVPMNADIMRNNLGWALEFADNNMVWMYVDQMPGGAFDWVANGMQPEWEDAVRVNVDLLLGDADRDGDVDLDDLTLLGTNFGSAGAWGSGDFDGNGLVDLDDLTILGTNFGTGMSNDLSFQDALAESPLRNTVPEPGTWLLLCLVGAVAMQRRCWRGAATAGGITESCGRSNENRRRTLGLLRHDDPS
jgi:hypothetical protein